MVNLLETLYALTAIGALVALYSWAKARSNPDATRRRAARRWTVLTIMFALGSAFLYVYLSPRP